MPVKKNEMTLPAIKARTRLTAEQILKMWKELVDTSKGDCWYRHDARQAYQDALEAMKCNGLIVDYGLEKGITIDG